MRITSIEFAGTIEKGQKLPRAFAKVTRKLGSDHIEVTILTPDLPDGRTHHVQADCEEDVWSMAECLQLQLEGVRGTNSDIHAYLCELQRSAD